jgi:hypothetical protein
MRQFAAGMADDVVRRAYDVGEGRGRAPQQLRQVSSRWVTFVQVTSVMIRASSA